MPRPRLYVRRFLNLPGHHGSAYVFIRVRRVSGTEGPSTEVTFTMTDCYDRISLDFDMETPAHRRNSLHKARVLRDATARLVDALEAESAVAHGKSLMTQ